AGGAGIERSAADRGAEEHASERLEGVHRVAEGEPGPGDPGYDRGGRHIDGRRPVFSKSNRHAVQVRPLSRRSRPRHAGSRRWPDRFHDRHGGHSLPQVRAGTIKAYALTAKTRLPAAPDIPTVDEAGLPGLYALNWQAVFVPKGTPKDVVTRLNSAIVTALGDATVRRRLADIGQEVFPLEQQTP